MSARMLVVVAEGAAHAFRALTLRFLFNQMVRTLEELKLEGALSYREEKEAEQAAKGKKGHQSKRRRKVRLSGDGRRSEYLTAICYSFPTTTNPL